MAATGQTINDRLNAVRYALAGQGLARTVCKATTEEVLAPKKKHMDYLLACTEEPNVSIPQLANLLIDRTQHASWAVVFKSLITIHYLLDYGNERFTQYLATSNHSFELNDFMDRTTPQGYNMSTFVRRYAKYINDKISSYKTLAIDLCKIKPGKDNALRIMNMENLTKTLPVVHTQFDSLLDFNIESKNVNNGIILAAFKLLYKDLNRIFAAYQEAIINLVERFFNLSRKKAREALNMYKKYLARMDKVANFFKLVEELGLDKSEMPDTSKLTSLLAVFETHLVQLEAKKRGTTPSSPPDDGAAEAGDEAAGSPTTSAKRENVPSETAEVPEKRPEAVATTPSGEQPRSPGGGKQAEAPSASGQSPTPAAAAVTSTPVKKQPPARPSPIVSPKVSPSEPKPTAGSSAPTPPAVPAAQKKAAPPERPAKPPSRPPPPAAAIPPPPPTVAAAAAVPAAQVAPTPPPPSATASSTGPSPTPPPHPPPPHPHPPTGHVQAARGQSPAVPQPPRTSSPPASAGPTSAPHEGNGSSETSQVDGSGRHADAGVNSSSQADDDGGSSAPACGNSETATGEVAPGAGRAETNHISTNDVGSNGLPNDLEPPPPPPLMEEPEVVPDPEVVPEPPPAIEGGDNGVAESVGQPPQREDDHADNNDADASQEPPPPPPPIEE